VRRAVNVLCPQDRYEAATGAAAEDTLPGLEAVSSAITRPPDAELSRRVADSRAPDPFDPSYLVYLRLVAAETSPVLYRRLCDILTPLPIDLVVIPGGVKQMPRIVFKCMVNYGGDFSRVSGTAACQACAAGVYEVPRSDIWSPGC